MNINYCHVSSQQVKKIGKQLDGVELEIVKRKIEAKVSFVVFKNRPQLTKFRLGNKSLILVWQLRDEKKTNQQRPIISWDLAQIEEIQQNDNMLHAIQTHVIAGLIVTCISAATIFVYTKWSLIKAATQLLVN